MWHLHRMCLDLIQSGTCVINLQSTTNLLFVTSFMTCDFSQNKKKKRKKKRELACFLITTDNELCCNGWDWVKYKNWWWTML